MEVEISRICSTWRSKVISYIKQKDKLLNPELYTEHRTEKPNNLNMNLFDDDLGDRESSDDDSSDDDSAESFVFGRNYSTDNNQSGNLFESSNDQSHITNQSNNDTQTTTSALTREQQIDAELTKYLNFNKEEFDKLCSDRGLTRKNPKKFEPVGAIVWEFWRQNKSKYPIIYNCIKTVLHAPTSSSAIERVFSKISAFVTHNKNAFKSKNLLALIQISQMDDFLTISQDCFRQNNVDFKFTKTTEESADNDFTDLFSDDPLLNFD